MLLLQMFLLRLLMTSAPTLLCLLQVRLLLVQLNPVPGRPLRSQLHLLLGRCR